ncbi:unnamed protein product [Closterium sp. NIES-64]|nr:unnamed protein product [Closterium sp. NIES-64]
MAGNVGIAVNGSANSEDKDVHGDASEDELHERIARAVKKPCARFIRVIQLTTAIALEAEATAANYARTMTLHIDPDDPDTPSSAHILASAYPHLRGLRRLELAKLDSLQSLPDSIGLLSTLHLRDINAASLPDSSAHLSSLKRLHLSHLSHMPSLPACVGKLPSLQEMETKFCARLTALPPSLAALSSLTALTIQHCESFASLPEDIGDVPRLASLVLDNLPSLAAIPDSLALLSSLTHLHAAHCQDLVSLPASFAGLSSLSRLQLLECSLELLPEDFGQLPALTELHLSQIACDLPDSFGQQLLKLRRLTITAYIDPSRPSPQPSSPHPLPSLRRLLILKFPPLSSLPSGLHLPSLLHLDIRDCVKFTSLPPSPSPSPFPPTLQVLILSHMLRDTGDMQQAISHLSSLQHRLHLSCMEFFNLPEDLGQMQGLRVLTIDTAPKLSTLPASLTLLTSLQHLMVSDCDTFSSLPEARFGNLASLNSLTLNNLPLLLKLPAAVSHLASLQVLEVQECKTFSEPPEGLGSARSLRDVYLERYSQLEDLPVALLKQPGRIQVNVRDL